MANKKYKLTDGNYWATDGVYDFDQGKTQREVNSDLSGAINTIDFAHATQISTTPQDLNNYTNGGVWFFLNAANPSNRPIGANRWGFLTVYNGGNADRLTQIWIDSSPIKNNIYIRAHNSTDGWCAWRKLNDDSRTGGNLVAFGDSWAEGTGIANASDRPTKRFTAIVARKLNMTEFEFASGGEKFLDGTIQAEIATATNNMTATQIADTKIVLIVGGINDYRTYLATKTATEFATAVINCANAAHTAFPNALIVLGIGNTSLSYFPHKAREWYKTAIRECEKTLIFPHICIKNLYNVISGLSECYENLSNPTRRIHPNDDGHAMFGGYIADAILGGGQHVSYTKDITFNTGWSADTVDTIQGYAQLTRNDDELTISPFKLKYANGAINGNFGFGSIPAALAPYTNLYWTAVSGNLPQGTFALIPGGGFRVIMPSSFTGDTCFVSNNAWLFGKEVNNDES